MRRWYRYTYRYPRTVITPCHGEGRAGFGMQQERTAGPNDWLALVSGLCLLRKCGRSRWIFKSVRHRFRGRPVQPCHGSRGGGNELRRPGRASAPAHFIPCIPILRLQDSSSLLRSCPWPLPAFTFSLGGPGRTLLSRYIDSLLPFHLARTRPIGEGAHAIIPSPPSFTPAARGPRKSACHALWGRKPIIRSALLPFFLKRITGLARFSRAVPSRWMRSTWFC